MTTPLSKQQITTLLRDLNPARVANRKQSGQTLSYLEAWDVKATLIRVFGFAGFSAEVVQSDIIRADEVANSKGTGMNWKLTAQATVKLTIHQTGATYTETAIGGSSQPDYTESADMAIKTAESDALKRAAIYLGTQFGLSLYKDGQTQDVVRVLIDPVQSATLTEEEHRSPVGPAEPDAPEATPEQIESAQALVAGAFARS